MIKQLRDYGSSAYKSLIEQTKVRTPFDYRPFQEHFIFSISGRENLSFKRMGLSVSVEVQAAFFSVQVAGM